MDKSVKGISRILHIASEYCIFDSLVNQPTVIDHWILSVIALLVQKECLVHENLLKR